MARHERVSGNRAPEAHIVASSQPGGLNISPGFHAVARLRDGKIVSPTESVLTGGQVRQFFAPADDNFKVVRQVGPS